MAGMFGGGGFQGMAGAPQALQLAYSRDPKLRLAQQLIAQGADTSPVQSPWQGVGRVAQALIGGYQSNRVNEDYEKQAQQYQDDMRSLYAPVQELQAGASGAGPRPDAQMTTRAPTLQEMLTRGQNVQSPFVQDQLRQLQLMGVQQQAEREARGRYVSVTDQQGNVIGQRNTATDKVEYMPAPMLDRWEPAQGPGGLPGQRNARTGEWKPADMRPVTNVNNATTVTGNTGPQMGPIPQGHVVRQNPDGSYVMEPIPGSPAAREVEKLAKTEAEGTRQQAQSADIVTGDIGRAIDLMDRAVLPTTGAVGGVLSGVGGTAARDVAGLLDTIKANTAFDKLAEMRKASPTGAALGSVTERELALLSAVRGNLEQSQSDAQLRYNLARLNNTVLDIVHGPGQGPQRMPLGRQAPAQGAAGPRAAPPRPPAQGQNPDINSLLDRYAPR
ncbi:MAG: hypothetical protein INF12_14590 [Methylobacterium sp.]|nr:hypothetical protein [Methylobacterium sp.]